MNTETGARSKVVWVILQQLKEDIAAGRLKKGDRLESERQMEQRLGFSRAAVREALKSLELMGIITSVQGDGNFIANNLEHSLTEPLSIMFMLEGGNMKQVHQLRHAMELATVTLAANAITPQQIEMLSEICMTLENPSACCTESKTAALDRGFHFTIMYIADNPLITTILNATQSLFENQITDVRRLIMKDEQNVIQVNIQHRHILRALEQHNAEMARKALSAHMEFIGKLIDTYLS